jgi:uncharacterized protein (TIGR00299 family) protein
MKILYYDCFAGLSGDMNLAAMIDLGVEPDFLRAELDKLGLGGEFDLIVAKDIRNGIHGTRVDVHPAAGADAAQSRTQGHGQAHDHAPHHPAEDAAAAPGCASDRNFADIRRIISASSLAEKVKETSLRIFHKIAEAEAKVHGKSVDEVHFHEVGATDSIVDIVGAAICFHRLGVDAVWASPIELGSGLIRCAHGLLPVPAPATVEILADIPTTRGATDHEATTPTGAAILAALVDTFTASPAMTVTKTGYGIGHRTTELPNLLRVHLADVKTADLPDATPARLLQCNIDDMTGEQLGDVMDLLMENGAMDVHFTAIMMKKNRPATQISLLCGKEKESYFKEMLFRHTTTLGVKSYSIDKTMLERRFREVETPYGPVCVKEAVLNGKVVHTKPEYEECKAIARRTGMPLAEVYAIVARQEKIDTPD